MWRHRAVNSRNGARIGVHTTGLPSGEPILLLSSLLADWRSWNDVAGRLPSGVYAITMDLRRSEEHTSELQSLMRNSYAVFCLTKNMTHRATHYIFLPMHSTRSGAAHVP